MRLSSPRALLPVALYGAVAAVLLRGAFAAGRFPGGPTGEGFGRMAVTGLVARWLRGESPWGRADLFAWPDGMSFWPVDPVVQAFAAPLSMAAGEPAALTAVAWALLALAGLGPYALARRLGAERAAAAAAGLVVQTAPYLMANLQDAVLEVIAVGVLAGAAAAIVDAVRAPTRRAAAWAGVAVAALAGTSPYLAIYLALGCAFAALATWRRWRGWAGVAVAGAVACGLVLLPLALAESGAQGRLGSGSGYSLAPPSDGGWARGGPAMGTRPPEVVSRLGTPGPSGGRPPGPPAAWRKFIRRAPGGFAVGLAVLVGLAGRAGRPWVALGLVFFLGGPGPRLVGRAFGWQVSDDPGVIAHLLGALPVTDSLGNHARLLVPYLLLAGVGAALSVGRRWWAALLLGGVAVADLWLMLPELALPSTTAAAPEAVIEAVDGPMIVFPSGDPPSWHPAVGPKESLFLAVRAGQPVAYDYGRGGQPADAAAVAVLAAAAAGEAVDPTALLGGVFQDVLLLEDRLSDDEVARVRAVLEGVGSELAAADGQSAWRIGVRP